MESINRDFLREGDKRLAEGNPHVKRIRKIFEDLRKEIRDEFLGNWQIIVYKTKRKRTFEGL